jgi:hypothetical protein
VRNSDYRGNPVFIHVHSIAKVLLSCVIRPYDNVVLKVLFIVFQHRISLLHSKKTLVNGDADVTYRVS